MIVDLIWLVGSVIGGISSYMNGSYLSIVVWAGLAAYALSNWINHRLQGSKYDY